MFDHRSHQLAVAVLVVAAGAAALPARAAERGYYAGGSYGSATARHSCDVGGGTRQVVRCDDSDQAWKALGGYQFNHHWGLEVAWADLGTSSVEFTNPYMSGWARTRLEGLTVAAVGSVPLGERFALYAKAGAFLWIADEDLRWELGTSSGTSSGVTQVAGVGARLRLGDRFALRAEVERYFSGDAFFRFGTDVDVASLGFVVEF